MRITKLDVPPGDHTGDPPDTPNAIDCYALLPKQIEADSRSIAAEGEFEITLAAADAQIIYWPYLVGAGVGVPCDRWEHGLYLEYYFDEEGGWILSDYGERAAPRE